MTVVVLAADGSPGSEAAAARLASRPMFAPPLVVHVVHVSPVLGAAGRQVMPGADLALENKAAAARAFDKANAVLAPVAGEIRRHWVSGDPAREIVALAAQLDADAIVVGARRRGALVNAILGSVAAAVLAKSHVPVVVVNREPGGPGGTP
ncbi:universal stress protein [Cupriavidus sp. 30B13]|uniref:universal stress protein n=1 Tax=Cupriavidus sp. 30B13 TaxID=3384241 RepID=UPI003B913DE0